MNPQQNRGERVLVTFAGTVVLLLLAIPMIIVALASLDSSEFFTFPPTTVSGRWYGEFANDSAWRASLILTLTVATISASLAMTVGFLAGVAISRSGPKVRRILYVVVVAPLIVPVIVLGISFYGLILELQLVGSLATFVVANTLLTAPLVTLLVTSAALGLDRRLEYASLASGAGTWRTLSRITLPLLAPSAAVGGVLAFLLSLDEVTIALFLIAPDRIPLAVRMFSAAETGTAPIVTAAATLLLGLSILLIGGLAMAQRARPAVHRVLAGGMRPVVEAEVGSEEVE